MFVYCLFFFFFKQKTAYEMRISDWSSDVCSSDLAFSAVASVGRNARGYLCFAVNDFGGAECRQGAGRARFAAQPLDEFADARDIVDQVDALAGRPESLPRSYPFGQMVVAHALAFRHRQGQIGREHVWTPVTNEQIVGGIRE